MSDLPGDEATELATVLADCRQRIDRIDAVLLALLRERLLTAVEAAEAKAALGESVLARDRETEIVARVAALSRSPLESTAAVRIFEVIIGETRAMEERLGAGPLRAGAGGHGQPVDRSASSP